MASGNFPNRPFRLEDRTWTLQQDVNGNGSLVRTQLWIVKTGYSPTYSGGGSSYSHVLNGAQVSASNNFSFDFTSSDQLLISQADVWVAHNADGTKAFAVDGYCNADVLGYTESHGSYALQTIPRATQPNFPNGNTFDAGAPVTISLPRASSGFTHDLTYAFGTIGWPTIVNGAGVSTSWTPDLSLLTQIPNATSGYGTVRCATKSGSTVIGTKDVTFYLKAPASVVPTISAVSISDDNPDVVSIVGKLVQGLSIAKGTVTAAGVYGSTVTQKSVTIDGTTAAEGVGIPVKGSGSIPVVGVVTDSRGRTGTYAGTISVLAYDVPKINTATAQRCSSDGTPQDSGAYLRVDLNAAVSSLVNGTEKNALTITVQTREHGTGAWTTRNTINPGLTHNTFFVVSGGGIFDVAKAWDVRISVADKFLTSQQDIPVGTERVIADFGPNGMGINKRWTQGGLDVAGDVYTDGEVRHRGTYPVEPVGVIHMFGGTTAPEGFLLCDGAAVSRTTYAALFAAIGTAYGVGNGSSTFNVPDFRGRGPMGKDSTTDFDTLGKTGGVKTVTLTADQSGVPAHNHGVQGTGTAYVANGSGGGNANITVGGGSYQLSSPQNNLSKDAAQPHPNLHPYVTVNFIIKAL